MVKHNPIMVIYNPFAGKKKFLEKPMEEVLPEIRSLFKIHGLQADFFPTKRPHHAAELAKKAVKEKYNKVVVIGGDGTANEAANGLVGSRIALGLIPRGTFMNVAKMLHIPMDFEGAIKLLKKGKIRQIDLGVLSSLSGEKLDKPYYFIETSGIGTEAHVQLEFKKWEKGNFKSFLAILQHIFRANRRLVEITADAKVSQFVANFVTVANSPISGASLPLAPEAQLADHKLTVVVYKHDPHKLLKHFLQLFFTSQTPTDNLITIKASRVVVRSKFPLLVHADASLFGKTPVHYAVKPAGLRVISG